MKKLNLFLAIIAAGICSAITYHIFENAVHGGIDLVWYDWFNTDQNRILIVPLTIFLSLIFFACQHYLDRKSENKEEHGLGEMPTPTISAYVKVLFIGFLSLLAGASLGPEAVLVPACMMVGALVGVAVSKDKQVIKLLTAAGIMALFTAFFNSFFVGVLSVALVTKQAKVKLSPMLLSTAVVASIASYITLVVLSGEAFFDLPHYHWQINLITVFFSLVLAAVGFAIVFAMDIVHAVFSKINKALIKKNWVLNAFIAALVISILYLLGGPLVEFTGNRSINPMFNDAASLGFTGMLWILIIKIVVIACSKAMGYRGGMIFPTIFIATICIAIIQLYASDFNMIYGIITFFVGAFAANSKNHILV